MLQARHLCSERLRFVFKFYDKNRTPNGSVYHPGLNLSMEIIEFENCLL